MGAPSTKRFTVRRLLGQGGMGVVYEAFDEQLGMAVALKTLTASDAGEISLFKRAFRSLQGLAHPNLVQLHDLLFEDGQWFFTMELLDGVDFVSWMTGGYGRISSGRMAADSRKMIADSRRMMTESAARITTLAKASGLELRPSFDEARLRDGLRQLLEGLATLHAADKVHRDVKPSNVLVTREGRVVLLDFGLLTETSADDSSETAVVGTPAYMAPEQAASLEVGPPADLYAVGVMLYEVLTGRLPIEGPQLQMLLEKQTREPNPPSSMVPGIPDDLDTLCRGLLRFDPARRPSAAEILASVARSPSRRSFAPRVSTETTIFVGRRAELAKLHATLEIASSGKLATALVCGDSGIGKSCLLRRFVQPLVTERPETMLLEGRCYERETVPYKTLDGIVDALSRRLSKMTGDEVEALLPPGSATLGQAFPAMLRVPRVAREHAELVTSVAPHELRQRAFVALRELLGRIASRRPTIIVIDDLQWGDEDGLRALAEILKPPNAPPLLLLGAVRTAPDGKDAGLERVLSMIPGEPWVIDLPELGREDAREVVVAAFRRADAGEGDAESVAVEAGGHPLFLEELTRYVALGGSASEHLTLDDTIWSRVARLEGAARRVAEIVAIAGKPVPEEVVAAAALLETGELTKCTATLRVANLVRTSGGRWGGSMAPYHDRVHEAVVARLEPDRKRALHGALASAFEASSHLEPETLAGHWRDADNPARAARFAEIAGDQAGAMFAFDRAAEWYELTLRLLPPSGTNLRDVRVKLGTALANAGRGALAAPHFVAAAAESPPMAALDLRRRAAEGLLSSGHFEEGDLVLKQVLAAVGIGLPQSPLVALLGLLAFRLVLFLRGLEFRRRGEDEIPAQSLTRLEACNAVARLLASVENVRGAYFQTRALLVALKIGEPRYVAHELSLEAAYVAAAGNETRSAKLIERARALAEPTGDTRLQALVEVSSGIVHFTCGRFQEALTRGDRTAEVLREHGPDVPWERRAAQVVSIWALGWMGNLNELGLRVERDVGEWERRRDIQMVATLRAGVPHLAMLRSGEVVGARAAVVAAAKPWTRRGYSSLLYWSLLSLARVDLYMGNGHAAHARVSREWSQVARAMILQVRIMGAEALHLRASAALAAAAEVGPGGGSERARMIRGAERSARRLASMHWLVGTPLSQLVHAGAAALRGDRARAAGELDAGARGFDEASMGLHAAAARWHLGHLRGGEEGRTLVAAAATWMKGQGIVDCESMAAMLAPGLRA